MSYSFCEAVTASGASPWHIRKLTQAGRKLGGGADTLALCGRKVSWDLSVPVPNTAPEYMCVRCKEEFERRSSHE